MLMEYLLIAISRRQLPEAVAYTILAARLFPNDDNRSRNTFFIIVTHTSVTILSAASLGVLLTAIMVRSPPARDSTSWNPGGRT